ncbi:MAG: thioredoxin domain-containing protein [Bacteroidota bacterium]
MLNLTDIAMQHKHTNQLINESSPYLLQHAHNPVNWISWSDDIYEIAQRENKLILISVGYSSCHWCHVMEHESFENEEVAEVMNRHFICVKVDREERPDIDQVYMTAVQLMTQRGGWPLNCITLPDGRPIYGGTYFPKDQWVYILNSLEHTWKKDPEKAIEYAEKLHEGIHQVDWLKNPSSEEKLSNEKLHEMVVRWSRNFDNEDGGYDHAPKFPMPNNYLFLLRYGIQFDDQKVLNHVEITLNKMAMGGIYDQIGGGFSRYSVDAYWKVPHFEKMLYDNAQLLSLYAQAYKVFKNPLYEHVILQTISWLEREMKHSEGSFYSALDADSEGEEGKFYCWSAKELEQILEENYTWIKEYYAVNELGFWEDEKYILLRKISDEEFASKMTWDLATLHKKVDEVNQVLLIARDKKVRPGLDDKCLTAWNALLLSGLSDAYAALGSKEIFSMSEAIATWLVDHQLIGNKLWRTRKNGQSTIPAFLEDSALTIQGLISYYEISFDVSKLQIAKKLLEACLDEFLDAETSMFYFTSKESKLISRKFELSDNVIPASNSVMATNLFKLGHLFRQQAWIDQSEAMLLNVYNGMENYGAGYSNWGMLLMNFTADHFEIAITGDKALENCRQLLYEYHPNILLAGGTEENIPFLKNKINSSALTFSVCSNDACFLPVNSLGEANNQLQNK